MEITLGFRQLWIAILTLLAARFIIQKVVPSRLDSNYAPKSGYELVPVDCFNSNVTATGVDIILIHGLGSNPDTTWKKLAKNDSHNQADSLSPGKNYVNWVTDFLCEDLPPNVRPHVRVFFYNYDSYWKRDAIEERRSRLGQELFEEVASMAVKTPERSIVFVGHSYGGLVVKEALIKAQFLQTRRPVNIFQQIKALIFLGTPHRGSASASLAVKAAQIVRAFGLKASPSIVEAITYDSVELQDMHRQFEAISDHVRIVNFYEKQETQGFWGLWSGLVVKEQSATLDRPNAETIGLHTDHSGLNKFAKRDSNYKKIRNKLVELMEAIIMGTSRPWIPEAEKLYTERSSLSDDLEEKLNKPLKGSDQVAHAVAIFGLGGTGKTQLALRYAERHKLRYDTILWIDARSEATIRSSFQRCARELKLLTETYSTVPDLVALKDDPPVRIVLSWLQNRNQFHGEWLVILDNADDLDGGLRDVIPSGVRGSIIITSRDFECVEVLPLGSQKLQVDIMKPSESISLLLRHLNLGAAEVTEDIRDLSLSICENLQHLAFAIHLAGAYIHSCYKVVDLEDDEYLEIELDPKPCLERYLQDYKNHKNQLLKDNMVKRVTLYNQTIWTVWDTSLDAIDKMSSFPSRLLLTLLAHMDPAKIQDEIFRLAAEGLAKRPNMRTVELPRWLLELLSVNENDQWDRFTFEETLKPLRLFGLVRYSKANYPGVNMHSLVQWRAKLDYTCESQQSWNLYYSIFMAAAASKALSEPGNAQFWQHMIPHLPLPKDSFIPESKAAGNIWVIGKLYYRAGRLREAEELLVRVIEVSKRVVGAEHPDTLAAMNNLALVYSYQGRLKEAEELSVQLMEAYKRVLGVEHPDTLAAMNTLALTYMGQNRLKEAEELFVRVIEVWKRVVGAEHPDTLAAMNNLASTYMEQHRLKEAKELFVRVIEVSKRVVGVEHPDTLTAISNLASTYSLQGRLKEAEELFVHVVEARKRVLGVEHRDTLAAMTNLALTYKQQRRLKEVEELFAHVMEARKRVLGVEHPDTLTAMSKLASTYSLQGRLKEVEELFVHVVEARKRVLGVEHPDTLTAMNNLASTYMEQHRLKEAKELFVRVIEVSKRVVGVEHPDTLTAISNLASTYSLQGRLKEAEELFVQVVEARKRVLGVEHPDTLTAMSKLASTYSLQGRLKEVEELFVHVVEARKRVLGVEHPDTLTAMSNLASMYSHQGRLKEAEELFAHVMEARKRVLGVEHPDTLTAMSNLASMYSHQGRLKEAEELFAHVMEARKRVLGVEHPDTLTAMSKLASTYSLQGRLKEVEELFVHVVEARKRVLGVEHPDTLAAMNNLALTYMGQNRLKEAEELFVRVIEGLKRVVGAEHPDTLTAISNLASTYSLQGRLKEVEELFAHVA
ncbi:hypothetical protein BKA67DRAFT_660234 [Truncatella angustata]|uniref:GPI inositol-deacylase n=1 Tax=Truncatella angustata TaxID=152316 RepID=A0A9P8UJL5_9PEZI|nr:uncharacterized protein BKA67DRAFT_660234 [Truncatella angustata]KAH6653678.1 hypothetical protein BKA67DRAFT_660234 [Truncatella angustata]